MEPHVTTHKNIISFIYVEFHLLRVRAMKKRVENRINANFEATTYWKTRKLLQTFKNVPFIVKTHYNIFPVS